MLFDCVYVRYSWNANDDFVVISNPPVDLFYSYVVNLKYRRFY